ncbi:MAG: extracellular solute-binding protein, partial [Armatimonadota bacterium]
KVLGIPMRGHAYTLFYRKDVFDSLGLKPPTTWAELEQTAQTIQSKTKLTGITPYYGINGGQNVFTWVSLLWSNGGDIFDAKNKPIFNNAAGVEATQRYVDWLNKLKITPAGSKTFTEGDGANEMVAGRTAMWIGWSWYYANFTNKALVAPEALGNIAFASIPSWEGKGTSASYGQIWETGIMKGSKQKDAAWEYLKWMTNPITEKWVALDKTDKKRDNVVVVHASNMQDADVNKLHAGLQQNMLNVLKTARTEPLIPDWLQVQGLLETSLNQMAGGAPVQATLDKTAAELTTLLTQLGYYK